MSLNGDYVFLPSSRRTFLDPTVATDISHVRRRGRGVVVVDNNIDYYIKIQLCNVRVSARYL